MPQDLEKIMARYQSPEPAEELLGKIYSRLRQEQAKRAKRRLAVFSLTLIASLAAIVPVCQLAWQDVSRSGFFDFAYLLFSDSSVVLTYWQNFILALLEALPVISLALVLATVAVFMESLKLLAKNFRNAYPRLA